MKASSLITMNEPHSYAAESYKMFRTNLSYMNLDGNIKVLMMTSGTEAEGKTTSTVNLAIAFAQEGKKVLLMECDLRKPRIHEIVHTKKTPGLTDVLSGKKTIEEAADKLVEVANLDLLTSGVLPPSPSDLFGTAVFGKFIEAAREKYDIVLMDTPPILHVSDAAILSRHVDGVVLVVAKNESKKDAVLECVKALRQVGANILGVLITKDPIGKKAYHYGYGNEEKKRWWSR